MITKLYRYIKTISLLNSIERTTGVKFIPADDVKGEKGKVMPERIGYMIRNADITNWYVIEGSERAQELALELLEHNQYTVRKVRISWYYCLGKCVNGNPTGWNCITVKS